MFLIFFAVLLTPFASFQSVEDIFNGKDEAKLSIKLNDIFSSSGRYSENIKADDSKISSLIQDDMLTNREKRQVAKKSSGIVKDNNKKRKPVRKTTTKKRKPVRKTTTKKRKPVRKTTTKKRKPVRRTTTKKPLRTTTKTTKKQIITTPTTKKLPTRKPLSTRRPIRRTTTSKIVDVFADYKSNLIKEMNKIRKKHHVAPLQLNTTIAEEVQVFVEHVVTPGSNVQMYNGPLGEIYYSGESIKEQDAIVEWLENVEKYDYGSLNFNFHFEMFTQMVWKNSKQVGCGAAKDEERLLVICRFYPKGNIDGEFVENVLRPN